jgi:hypothetical protein
MRSILKFVIIDGLEPIETEPLLYEDLILIPEPQKIITFNSQIRYKLGPKNLISFINVEEDSLLFKELMEYVNEYSSISLKLIKYIGSEEDLFQKYSKENLLSINKQEAYNIINSDGLLIIFSISERGLFYGIQTLIQLLKNYYIIKEEEKLNYFIIPELEIKDSPDLSMRGVAQDVSRGQVCTVENAKRYIKKLSHYKMNFYCLYIEDMFTHPDHPLIGKQRGAFTCKEIKEIDAYAKDHFIELISIFECLGHVDNILQHKEYWYLGEFPGAQSLDISNPEIYPFLTDYISKLSECFSTQYFHIGCDESFDVGKYNSREYIETHGKSQALAEFYNKIHDIAKKNNNENVIMYDDIVRKDAEILENLNKNMILMYWEYNPKIKNPPVEKFIEAGHRVIVSPSMLNWNRNFPDNKNVSENIINMIELAYKYRNKGCLGVLTSTWGDQRYFSLRENEIFGAIFTAGKAWNVKKCEYDNFKNKYGFLFYGIEKESLNVFKNLFTLLSSTPELYYRLRLLLPPLFYTDFFKHPFPSQKYKPGMKNYKKLEEIGKDSLELYDQLIETVNLEKHNFEYIQFGAELAKYGGEKIRISVEISNQLRKRHFFQKKLQKIIDRIKYIQDKIIYLKNKYERLWLRAAKRPCLDYNLRLFDFLINAYNAKIAQIKKNIYFKNPYLESEWIWTNEKISPRKPRFFRKVIEINKPVKKALIQATVNTYMKIFINNKFIGEVLGRFSLSRLPILLRVQVFDITNYLNQGKNIIAIEAVNYDKYKGAFNLFGEIKLNNGGIVEILTNETWKYSKNENFALKEEWRRLDFESSDWQKVKSYGPPPNLNGDIMKPDLLKGEKSLTQDYFGAPGYYYNAVNLFFGKIMTYILRHLIDFIIRYGRLYG